MSKSELEDSIPDNCWDCKMRIEKQCSYNGKQLDRLEIRPDWCPMEERIQNLKIFEEFNDFIRGER